MIYLKDKGTYKCLKEIAVDYDMSYKLILGRYIHGVRNVADLVRPKYEKLEKSVNDGVK